MDVEDPGIWLDGIVPWTLILSFALDIVRQGVKGQLDGVRDIGSLLTLSKVPIERIPNDCSAKQVNNKKHNKRTNKDILYIILLLFLCIFSVYHKNKELARKN